VNYLLWKRGRLLAPSGSTCQCTCVVHFMSNVILNALYSCPLISAEAAITKDVILQNEQGNDKIVQFKTEKMDQIVRKGKRQSRNMSRLKQPNWRKIS